MTFAKLRYIITHNVFWANQKTDSFAYHWLCTHAMFDIMSEHRALIHMFCQYVIQGQCQILKFSHLELLSLLVAFQQKHGGNEHDCSDHVQAGVQYIQGTWNMKWMSVLCGM